MRVGQLDSELLDQELVQLLQDPLNKTLALVNSSFKTQFDPELTLLIQLTLYKLSIWNIGASYGAKLQDLRYVVPSSHKYSLAPSGLPRRTLLIHGTLTILIPYIHNRIRVHALSRAWPDAPSSDRRRKVWNVLVGMESAYMACGLVSFVAFLWDGRYRTIADRLLCMSLVPSRRLVKRDVSYEFMNRQMVWHAFTEFLLFLLPLIGTRSVRRRISRLTSRINVSSSISSIAQTILGASGTNNEHKEVLPKEGKYSSLSRDQCAICAENASFSLNLSEPVNAFTSLVNLPVPSMDPNTSMSEKPASPESDPLSEPPTHPLNTPYITSCGHLYCYHCLADRMMRTADDEGTWECLRCREGVKGAERWVGDVTEEQNEGSEWDGDGFSSISDFESGTDISDSIGYSISEPGSSEE
ncbi:hypothetical protein PILCRDRAFT_811429 [Piloderma croceum F 1598]|uniref:RING-type E3 ubiquitin transferase (cysteine targeting) n=1 Tax=Piloderma croceum (strain F 1598) TaxID=765440 RepID=A0A0C3G3Q8_PILCF|nr:hypothetical protein PILCRDRAFT_811429 [Piloderma croceum F 1598]